MTVFPSDLGLAFEIRRREVIDWRNHIWPRLLQWHSLYGAFTEWAIIRMRGSVEFNLLNMLRKCPESLVAKVVELQCGRGIVRPNEWLVSAAHDNNAMLAKHILYFYPGIPAQLPAAYASCMRDSLEVLRLLQVPGDQLPLLLVHAHRYGARRAMQYLIQERRVSPTLALEYQYVLEEEKQFLLNLIDSECK